MHRRCRLAASGSPSRHQVGAGSVVVVDAAPSRLAAPAAGSPLGSGHESASLDALGPREWGILPKRWRGSICRSIVPDPRLFTQNA